MVVIGRRSLALAGAAAIAGRDAKAQGAPYPSRTVRVVVPYAAGGSSDVVARLVAARLQPSLGQAFVVENRAGAGSMLGTEAVARAAPDGHTLLLADTPHGILPALQERMPYDAIADFTPVTLVAATPQILFVHPSVSARTPRAFLDAAKAQPERFAYASAGIGTSSHLTAERLQLLTGAKLTHVPYRGAAPALTDLAAGQVQAFFATIASGAQLIRDGQIRALGVLAEERLPALPDVPTFREDGLDLVVESWFGLLAPANVPPGVVDRLAPAVRDAVATPEVADRFRALGIAARAEGPDAFARMLRAETTRWREVVQATGVRLQ
ncbi:Bug family tripartite tricarboxylate transporter substrate binding protein [Roseomonas sp. CCTCC AB2023176]|uniref:Bug family tripartite tricarboxylate transporter substrate binding protein n=1 Tax=Roseomonas sp. CCTCC AB2023176 TaxID=3342640 RepID=UPI0035DE53C2